MICVFINKISLIDILDKYNIKNEHIFIIEP